MKTKILICLLCLVFAGCDLFNSGETEPAYKAKIIWDSGLYTSSSSDYTVHENHVYFFERRHPGTGISSQSVISSLTKLDAGTGKLVWRTHEFRNFTYCQPSVIGNYVYVLLAPDIIACFDRETGKRTATAEINIENMDLRFWNNVTAHRQYLYLELSGSKGVFFARLDVNSITHGEPDMPQNITPEVLWKNVETAPGNIFFFHAKPVVYGNTVYVSTYDYRAKLPVQLAGFDTDTGQMVFHVTFGGSEDQTGNIPYPEKGGSENPILIHDGILYFLGLSIAAWNLETEERLYRHVFTYDTPEQKIYTSATYQALFYNGKIYFTSGDSYDPQDGFRNIHCMDAATGKLIWNTITEGSESLVTNPVISGGRLYIPQFHGLFVFDPENGKLTGVDRSFHGAGHGRNIMHGDYMITARRTPAGSKLVAVNIGR